MNNEPPPPIEPSLLDARIKPLVPQKRPSIPPTSTNTNASKSKSTKQEQLKQQEPATNRHGNPRPEPTSRPPSAPSAATGSMSKTNLPSAGSGNRKPSAHPDQTTASKPSASDSNRKNPKPGEKQGAHNPSSERLSAVIWSFLFGIVFSVAVFFVFQKTIQNLAQIERLEKQLRSHQQRNAEQTTEIQRLMSDNQTVRELLDKRQERIRSLELAQMEWAAETNRLHSSMSQLRTQVSAAQRQERTQPPTKTTTSRDTPTLENRDSSILRVNATIDGNSVPGAVLFFAEKDRTLPRKLMLTRGARYSGGDVRAEWQGNLYSGRLDGFVVNWEGERSVSIPLRVIRRKSKSDLDDASDGDDAWGGEAIDPWDIDKSLIW